MDNILMHQRIYNIFDLIEEFRGQDDIIAKIKEYCHLSDAFIASVVKFEQEISSVSPDREVTYVKLKGEQELCKVFSVDEKGYRIQANMANAGRGISERIVPAEQVSERLYD